MQLDDEKYMRLAIAEAKKAYAIGEVPIGAVIIDDEGNVVASAHNLREKDNDATAHAELIAIQKACQKLNRWRLTGLTLYVTIEPCPMCAGAIVMSRLTRVVYGAPDAKAGACESIFNITGSSALNHNPLMTAGVLPLECSGLMKSFFAERRKKNREKSSL